MKTARAWAIKKEASGTSGTIPGKDGLLLISSGGTSGQPIRVEPVIKAARTFPSSPLQNVLTYFRHPVTNAVCEGVNSKIQTIIKMAYGFRNRDHLKTAIYSIVEA